MEGPWRHHPGTREEYWLKNLRKVERLSYDLDRVLMVDDESHTLEKNHGNYIIGLPAASPRLSAQSRGKIPVCYSSRASAQRRARARR